MGKEELEATHDAVDAETLAALRSAFEDATSALAERVATIVADAARRRDGRLRELVMAKVMEALSPAVAAGAASVAAPDAGGEAEETAGRRSSREVILSLLDATGGPISRSDAQAAVLAEGLTRGAFKKVWTRLVREGAIERVPDGEGYVPGRSARDGDEAR